MRFKNKLLLTNILILLSFSAYAAENVMPKFWPERNSGYNYPTEKVDGYTISLGPIGNAKYKFYADLLLSEKQFHIRFDGYCGPIMDLKSTILNDRVEEYKNFQKSEDFSHLKLKKPIDAMRKVLAGQCSNLDVIRVTAFVRNGPFLKTINTVTLQKDNNWDYEEGLVASKHDEHKQFDIKFRDMSGIDVAYSGTCSEEVRLGMNHPKKGIRNAISESSDYTGAMLAFLNGFSSHCPSVSKVKITPSTLPTDHICEDSRNCYASFVKNNNAWALQAKKIKYSPPESYTFATILNILANEPGRQKIDDTYKLFFVEYIEHVSRLCGQLIAKPVHKEMVYEEVDREFGVRKETGRVPMLLDARLVDEYLKYYDQRKGILFKWQAVSKARSMERGSGGTQAGLGVFDFYFENVKELERHFRSGCDSNQVKAVYHSFSAKHL